ncbi:hypothetical protein [Paenibacillus kobensis]|uniref:hypothetical protein n=1 Tax=Paenibacillus kobensis TaxID=59841 RepID=UPI000FD9CDC5|nr:hypothetical protein [Paenibacillus kobensis]
MFDFIAEHIWQFLVIAEAIFWITMLTAITLKYWFGHKKAAFSVFVFTIVNELWILFLGIVDMRQSNELTGFQIIIIILLLYTLLLGKHQMQKIDRSLYRVVARIKKEQTPAHVREVKYGKDKAIEEMKLFGLHVLLFLSAHAVFYLFVYFGNRELNPVPSGHLIDWLRGQFQLNESLVQMNKIWSVVLLLDALISFSYLFLPKKPDETKDLSQ